MTELRLNAILDIPLVALMNMPLNNSQDVVVPPLKKGAGGFEARCVSTGLVGKVI